MEKVIIICPIHGEFEQKPNNHIRGNGCPSCGGTTKLTTDEFISKATNIHGERYDYSKVLYLNCETKVIIICSIHGEFTQLPRMHLIGQGCPYCGRKIVSDSNRLSIVRPDLIKYFKNRQDADKYSFSSKAKVTLICPDCGKEKENVAINNLSNNGFSCDCCSDGISMPEKFGRNLFKQLDLCFETQKIFDWSKNKRYDMYFTLNGEKHICEIHGIQHYEEITRGRSLQEEQENDKLKYDLAIQNGIKPESYIVVDARYSEFEWLRENFIKQLEHIIDLSSVDWSKVWIDCQTSMLPKIWDYWNSKDECENVMTISKLFDISSSTIRESLKIGNEYGKCVYDAKEELRKSNNVSSFKRRKTVYQYSKDGEFIQEWSGVKNVARELNINYNGISLCCLGKHKSAGGFKWSYKPPENKL